MRTGPMRVLAAMLLLGVSAASTVLAAEPALPEVYKLVPADATVAVVLRSPRQLDAKLQALGQQLNFQAPALVSLLKQQSTIEKGIAEDGTLMLVLPAAAQLMAAGPTPPVMFLVPVQDYAAMVQSLGGDAKQPVTQVNLPTPEPFYARNLGTHALISPSQALVQAYQPAAHAEGMQTIVGKVATRALQHADAAVVVNFGSFAPVVAPMLSVNLAMARNQLLAKQQQGDPDALAMGDWGMAGVNLMGDGLTTFLRDTTAIVLTADIQERGLAYTSTIQFRAGSQLAGVFGTGQGVGDILSRLEDKPYVLAAGYNYRGIDLKTILSAVSSRLPQDKNPWLKDVLAIGLPMMDQPLAFAGAEYQSPAGEPAGQIGTFSRQVSIVEAKDPAAYRALIRTFFEKLNGVSIPLPQEMLDQLAAQQGLPPRQAPGNKPAQPATVSFKTQYQASASPEGVDEFQMLVSMPPALLQANASNPALMQLASQGAQGYLTTKGPYVVMTQFKDEQALRSAAAQATRTTGIGSQGPIAQLRSLQDAPATHIAETYLDTGALMAQGNVLLTTMGVQPVALPANLPPLAVFVSMEDHGLAMRAEVPMPVVKAGKDVGEQLWPLLQLLGGGMQPDAPEGDAPPRNAPPRRKP